MRAYKCEIDTVFVLATFYFRWNSPKGQSAELQGGYPWWSIIIEYRFNRIPNDHGCCL